jgi:hypothetical protein
MDYRTGADHVNQVDAELYGDLGGEAQDRPRSASEAVDGEGAGDAVNQGHQPGRQPGRLAAHAAPDATLKLRAPRMLRWWEAGFKDLVPVVPPGVTIAKRSKLLPEGLGKAPGVRHDNDTWSGFPHWRVHRANRLDVVTWQGWNANTGLRAPYFPAVDIDIDAPELAWLTEDFCGLADMILGPAPSRCGKWPKLLLMYRTDEPMMVQRVRFKRKDRDEKPFVVEMLGCGQQYVIAGTHPSGRPYTWDQNPCTLGPAGLTTITRAQVETFLQMVRDHLIATGFEFHWEGRTRAAGERSWINQNNLKADPERFDFLERLVAAMPNDNEHFPHRDEYLKLGFALKAAFQDDEERGYAVFEDWALKWPGNHRCRDGNDPETVRSDWARMKPPFAVGEAWLLAEATRCGLGAEVAREEFGDLPEDDDEEPAAKGQGGAAGGGDGGDDGDDAGPIYTLEQLIELVDVTLSEASDDAMVRFVLREVARAALASKDEINLLVAIKRRTRRKLGTLRATLKELRGKQANDGDGDADNRPVIKLSVAAVIDNLDKVERHLKERDVPLAEWPVFAFGESLAVIRKRPPLTARQLIERENGVTFDHLLVDPLDVDTLREHLCRSIRLQKFNGRLGEWVDVLPPDDFLRMVLKRKGRGVRRLTGVQDVPTVTPEGELLATPGYHGQTGLYFHMDGAAYAGLKPNPTRAEAEEAWRYLTEVVFAEFPFAGELDRAAAVALLLTALFRRLMPKAPGFVLKAPMQSSGKTALADMVSCVAHGAGAAAAAYPKNDEEASKRIIGMLREGLPYVVFDNVPDGATIDNNSIARAMTSEVYQDRILHTNIEVMLPSHCVWVFTGNAVTAGRDMATRLMFITLAPDTDRPDKRTFVRKELDVWAKEHRAAIVTAALTLVRWSFLAGPGEGKPCVTRYGREFLALVLEPIRRISGIDVTQIFDRNVDADSAVNPKDRLHRLLRGYFGEAWFTAADVLAKVEIGTTDEATLDAAAEFAAADGTRVDPRRELLGLVEELRGAKLSPQPVVEIGRALALIEDRPLDGYRLTASRDTDKKIKRYRFWPLGG